MIDVPHGGRRGLIGLLALCATALGAPSGASAFTSAPVWKCRASALSLSVSGMNRVEPIVANGNPNTGQGGNPDREQCVNADQGASSLPTQVGLPPNFLQAPTVSALTTITPALGFAVKQAVGAQARVENLQLLQIVPGNTNVPAVGVQAALATVSAKCDASSLLPKYTFSNNVATLTLGGKPINLDGLITGLTTALKPLGMLITIVPNERFTDAGGEGVRALHIKVIPSAGGAPLLDAVIAEAKIGADGPVCDPNKQFPDGIGFLGGSGGSGGGGTGGVNGSSNGTIGSSRGPAATCGRLSMYFVPGKRSSVTNRFGKRLVTRGRLVTCGKKPKPIVGARIDVFHIRKGHKQLVKTGLKSRPGGKLTLILPSNLTTRNIQYSYRADLSKKASSSVTLHLTVKDSHGRIVR